MQVSYEFIHADKGTLAFQKILPSSLYWIFSYDNPSITHSTYPIFTHVLALPFLPACKYCSIFGFRLSDNQQCSQLIPRCGSLDINFTAPINLFTLKVKNVDSEASFNPLTRPAAPVKLEKVLTLYG